MFMVYVSCKEALHGSGEKKLHQRNKNMNNSINYFYLINVCEMVVKNNQ